MIYLFQSEGEVGVYALSIDETGSNLPSEYAPWRLYGTGLLKAGLIDVGAEIRDAIERDGFYLLSDRE